VYVYCIPEKAEQIWSVNSFNSIRVSMEAESIQQAGGFIQLVLIQVVGLHEKLFEILL